MLKRLGQGWAGTRALAWAVAYCLVAQLILVSAFAGASSGGAAPTLAQLCLGETGSAGTHGAADEGTADAGTKALSHCPLCLSRADAGLLPAPPAVPVRLRSAVIVRFEAEDANPDADAPTRVAHRPRGPPGPA